MVAVLLDDGHEFGVTAVSRGLTHPPSGEGATESECCALAERPVHGHGDGGHDAVPSEMVWFWFWSSVDVDSVACACP